MKILAIETSCDETAIAIIDAAGGAQSATFTVLGNALLSQIDIHKEYGGVFPALAKREHAKNLVPILEAALEEAELLHEDTQALPDEMRSAIAKILEREPGLEEQFFAFISECETPAIDAIAVTAGPGLEPALWVGINFAKALSLVWGKPLVAVNHMEGHILAGLAIEKSESLAIENIELPVLALLISGGHTELVLMRDWLTYELIGATRDDAVGEAFDKVARMLNLPYPGGPEISRLAEAVRNEGAAPKTFALPRPMIDSNTCDFSFAGLKTAVLYLLKNNPDISEEDKRQIAHEFENAVAEVLWKKTSQALEATGAKTLVIGGGVSANTHIRRTFTEHIQKYSDVSLCIPAAALTTDNAVMIALAGYYRALKKDFGTDVRADGNLSLAPK
jgi:N6-L-threonylcarbamoyladenine synthase